MKKRTFAIAALMALLLVLIAQTANAAHKVGNGDDGGDLEDLKPLTSGPLFEARQEAIVILSRLGTPGIRALGMLIPEVERTPLFICSSDKPANLASDQGAFHADMQGRVFARTFAEPHAATRFFPVANSLNTSQRVALHIHEALHRSLPDNVRENEAIVSQLTLAIAAPGANRDDIQRLVDKTVPVPAPLSRPSDGFTGHYQFGEGKKEFRRISNVSYSYRMFLNPSESSVYPIYGMHLVQSELYPFGGENTPFGMGIEGAMISSAAGLQSGPLGLSARLRIWEKAGFDVGLWGVASLNTLSYEELKNSPYGRSVYTAGLFIRKRLPRFYVENFLSYTFPGETTQTVNLVNYRYDYGGVVNAKIRAGMNFQAIDVGVFGEIHLANFFRVSGGSFGPYDSGAYRLVSVGPEMTFHIEGVSTSVFGRFIIDSTKDANFDYLGNLMGAGVAQGSLGMAVSYAF